MLADLLVSAFFSSIRDVEKQHLLSIEFAGSIRFLPRVIEVQDYLSRHEFRGL